jgi:hypothetical protein
MMDFSDKLLDIYLHEGRRISALHKFINSTGMDYTHMDRKKLNKISRQKRYKQWKRIKHVQKIMARNGQLQIESSYKSIDIEPHKKYKHLDSSKLSKKQAVVSLIGKGYSVDQYIRTARKYNKFGRAKVVVGKHAYRPPKKGEIRFRKSIKSPTRVGSTLTTRLPRTRRELLGKTAMKFKIAEYKETQNMNNILEQEAPDRDYSFPSKVDKLVSKNRELKVKVNDTSSNNHCEYEVSKTLSGKKGQDVIEINPKS